MPTIFSPMRRVGPAPEDEDERDGQHLTEVQAQRRRRVLCDHDLVGAGGIGHPPAGDREAVLVEEESVNAPHHDDVAVEAPLVPRLHERRPDPLVGLDAVTCG